MAIRSALVDAYHARLPAAERKALEQIRKAVHAACPGAEECLSYGMPAVKFEGKPLVGWRAAAKHGAFHPLSGSTVEACQGALAGYDTSKGTIRFPFDAVLPAKLIQLLVATRIKENGAEGSGVGKPKKTSPAKAAGEERMAKKSAAKTRTATKKVPTKRAPAKRGVAKGAGQTTKRRAN